MSVSRRISIYTTVLFLISLASCRERPVTTVSTASGSQHSMPEGDVSHTSNPQVASYSVAPQDPADVTIFFGPDQSHLRKTWTQTAAGQGKPLTIYVAGMEADSVYHMHAQVKFKDGAILNDPDHVFKTGALPKTISPIHIAVQHFQSAPAQQPGLELLNGSTGELGQVEATDLDGHILWTYHLTDWQSQHHLRFLRWKQRWMEKISSYFQRPSPIDDLTRVARRESTAPYMDSSKEIANLQIVNPVKPLKNGNFAVLFGFAAQGLVVGPLPDGAHSAVREVDLAGKTVREITIEQLNEALHRNGHPDIQLQMFHHDVEVLPNGHWLVLANEFRPGTHPRQGETDIFGDMIIELDNNLQPVWTWNTFDHLDLHRRPLMSPDWTHANAIVYTPDDGNLLLSMRHQSWVIKIDYENGHGSGKILWRLGAGGDFKLLNGHDPEDWAYAQHFPSIVGPRSAGVFQLTMMDNGLGRPDADGVHCKMMPGMPGKGAPCYSTVPVFEIDEQAKTARIVARKVFPPGQFSLWGGSAEQLANGNFNVALSSQRNTKGVDDSSSVVELAPQPGLETIWKMKVQVPGQIGDIYRAIRIPSLYPGVQW
ncbi:aryl-sulfate sulfotransferase [Silvibacterium acidisoli]|uniref:aryl-sulfate sulfotransferase n=1 Tax=Acidobacteriaceae bacterium ZG23-2 TaxID=2883246 RepID=UPI00406CD699